MAINYKDENGVIHSLIPDMNNIDDSAASASTTYSSSKIDLLLNNKQNAEAGKGLSSNDFTDDDKTAILNSPIISTSTTSPITDSSNGMVQGLTIYGRSEVIEGEIKSVGEGYAVVDLGTTDTWGIATQATNAFYCGFSPYDIVAYSKVFTDRYQFVATSELPQSDKCITVQNKTLVIRDTAFSDAQTFSNSLNGLIMCYKKATPTGNTIAVKTDDGTGIDGTMATFTTGTPLRSVSDTVRDVMEWGGSAGMVTRNCFKIVIDSTSNIYKWDSVTNGFILDPPLKVKSTSSDSPMSGISTVPVKSRNDLLHSNEVSIGCTSGGVSLLFTIPNATTIEEAQVYLQNNPISVVYELATPITTPLTTAEISAFRNLRTFDNTTNITITDSPDFELDYLKNSDNGQAVANVQKDLQRQIDEVSSQIDEVKNEKNHFCYSYKINLSDSDPATCVKPHFDTRYGCDNFSYTSAKMNYTTGVFDYGSWEGFIRRIARPCMLKYDGTVDYYLDPDDYSKKITGEASDVADVNYQGNAMVELEKLYFKRYIYNGIQYCFISDRKLDKSFKCYAHHDKYGKELDYIYRACYDGMYDGTRLRSISGVDYHNLNALTVNKIMSNTTRTEEIAFAQANNVTSEQGEGWYILHKSEWDYINDILFLIGMSTDVQTTFGCGRDSGYVSATDTGIISTGTMDDKGLFWGKNDGSAGVKVLGIENHWANLYKSMAGYINASGTQKIKQTYGTEDGSAVIGFNTDGTGYVAIIGATPTKGDSSASGGGYITAWKYNDYGLIPYECASAGSSTKFIPDYFYFNNNQMNFALVGGSSSASLHCGLFVDLPHAAGDRNWALGAALSYKPLSAA